MIEFRTDNLKPFFPDVGDECRDVSAAIATDLRHVQPVERRTFRDMMHVANAARALEKLPEPGEVVHVICKGNWSAFDLIPATLELAAPAVINHLTISTLGFSKANVAALAQMMDEGKVGRVSFLFSAYFRSTSRGEASMPAELLIPRGARVASVRNHSKIILMELSDDRFITFETSANLRSCRNLEQFSISNDCDLLMFHKTWIESVIGEGDEK